MEYLLIRHADAIMLENDFERILSHEGIKQCIRQQRTVQKIIRNKSVLTYCSPTKRTLQTAALLGLPNISICNELIEPTSTLFVSSLPRDSVNLICIVGHNPLLSTLLEEVSGLQLVLSKGDLVYLIEKKFKLELVLYKKALEDYLIVEEPRTIYSSLYAQTKAYEALLKEDPTSDNIHELRLVINQLRSFYKLYKKEQKELEYYYHLLGKIRRIDLLLEYTQSNDLLKQRNQYLRILPTLVKSEMEYSQKKLMNRYTALKNQYVVELDTDFHEARKTLKNCIHWVQLFKLYEPELEQMKERSKDLGKKHDYEVLLKDCKSFSLGKKIEDLIHKAYQPM